MTLAALVERLRNAHGVVLKRDIQDAARLLTRELVPAADGGMPIRNGDDAAAIPDAGGYVLLAAEGMLPSFVQHDPWFAGYCAVMVNVNDVLAMGGRPSALVNVMFAGDDTCKQQVLQGMHDAAQAFGVPIVGGHTSRLGGGRTLLAAAIVGKASALITSFDAEPGDALWMVVDLRGHYRGESAYFDAATRAPRARIRAQLELLPALAESGLVKAGKDISMAGIAGTLTMLCEASGVGATLMLDRLPRPAETNFDRWLTSFPSFGFLLAVKPQYAAALEAQCTALELSVAQVGTIDGGSCVALTQADEWAQFWDLAIEPLTGFGPHTGSKPARRAATRKE